MRISSANFNKQQIDFISKKYMKMGEIQTQISTGKKFQKSSADPVVANRIKRIEDYLAKLNSYKENSVLADKRSNLFESVSQDSIAVIGRVQELLQTALNGTLNNSDRANVARELQGCLDNLLHAANTVDSNGEYIFSGTNSQTPAYSYSQGSYIYNGSKSSRSVDVGPNTSVLYAESGFDIFSNIKLGNGTFTVSANAAVNTGTGVADGGSVMSVSQYVPDTYTVSFVTNAAGHLAYQVTGNLSGQVVPALPAVTPAAAPDYASGSSIEFNGASVTITGQPNVGDVFTVAPSATQNIFTTLQQTIARLQTPAYTAAEKALFQSEAGQCAGAVQQAAQHFVGNLAEIGARSAVIAAESDHIENIVFAQEVLYGQLANADPVKVASDLAQTMNSLQAMQQTYAKIQELISNLIQL